MPIKIATWNINSVRLRIELVVRVLRELQPDILCLQETKCPPGQFPAAPLAALGYGHIIDYGQKSYNGVAVISRLPLIKHHSHPFCTRTDCRHMAVVIKADKPVILHNLYVPAGGDEADVRINPKFQHKLDFLGEMETWFKTRAVPRGHHGVVVGDLNIAPFEHDVWSHKDLLKIVSHTPVETEGLLRAQKAGKWVDVMRKHVPANEKLYTWWSYRAQDWQISNRGRRLDHIWATKALAETCSSMTVMKETRGWVQTSDHVPVMATFDIV